MGTFGGAGQGSPTPSPTGGLDGPTGSRNRDPIIPDYLVPIGDSGFWITPDEPAEPDDCERYPDSPWCGGTGIDLGAVFGGSIADASPSISFNNCEVCVEVKGSLFYVALAPIHVCYRSKTAPCQPPPPDPIPPPDPPGGPEFGSPEFFPFPGGFGSPGCPCIGVTEYRIFLAGYYTGEIGSMDGTFAPYSYGPPVGFYWIKSSYELTNGGRGGEWYYRGVYRSLTGEIYLAGSWRSAQGAYVGEYGQFELPKPVMLRWIQSNPSCSCPNSPPITPTAPPYVPPVPPDCCRKMCCKGSNAPNEQSELLKLIARRLGVQNYPVSTPKWFVTNQGEGNVRHESLTEFSVWMARQMDALLGEFPVSVEIEDADPTKEGDQKKKIHLHNVAESLAEIYGLSAKTSIDADVHTSFLMRLAAEMVATKTAALIAQDYASANASYLGYRGNAVKRKVDFAFDPTKLDSLQTILNNSRQDFVGWENTDQENLAAYMQKLMFSAGLIKTVFFRKGSDLERILNEIRQFIPTADKEADEKWDAFLAEVRNPESPTNKESQPKPDIKNLKVEQQQGDS